MNGPPGDYRLRVDLPRHLRSLRRKQNLVRRLGSSILRNLSHAGGKKSSALEHCPTGTEQIWECCVLYPLSVPGSCANAHSSRNTRPAYLQWTILRRAQNQTTRAPNLKSNLTDGNWKLWQCGCSALPSKIKSWRTMAPSIARGSLVSIEGESSSHLHYTEQRSKGSSGNKPIALK